MSETAALDVAALRPLIERRFKVYDVQTEDHVIAFYVDVEKDTLETSFDALKGELKKERLVPLLKYQGGEHAIYVLRNPVRTKRSLRTNLVLFLATILTTTFVGTGHAFSYYNGGIDTTMLTQAEYYGMVFAPLSILTGFVTFALPLMLILTVHELGHYVMARRHGIEASLPYFIPVPFMIGTFGAFISMREPMPNRKALFDVGAAGPIAGFVVTIPILLIGLWLMASNPITVDVDAEGMLTLGTPLLYDLLAAPFGITGDALTHPTAFAAWVGLFVTAINLLPAGQLDGGHIAASMFGERARFASYAAVLGLVVLGLAPMFGYPGYETWLFFAILIGLLGIRHPPTLNAVSDLDDRRRIIGWITYGVGVLCFTLIPISG